jgi:hypothetical protein
MLNKEDLLEFIDKVEKADNWEDIDEKEYNKYLNEYGVYFNYTQADYSWQLFKQSIIKEFARNIEDITEFCYIGDDDFYNCMLFEDEDGKTMRISYLISFYLTVMSFYSILDYFKGLNNGKMVTRRA